MCLFRHDKRFFCSFFRRGTQQTPVNAHAVTWRTGKYHAVRLHDVGTGEVLSATQKQGVKVTYEIWHWHQKVNKNNQPINKMEVF